MAVSKKDKIRRSMPEELSFLADTFDEIIDLVNELKTDHNAHIADTDAHTAADTTNTVAASSVTAID